jgi:hypothetical protein
MGSLTQTKGNKKTGKEVQVFLEPRQKNWKRKSLSCERVKMINFVNHHSEIKPLSIKI